MSKNEEQRAGERMVLYINAIAYAFRWCPPGTFMMGDGPGEVSVTLSHGFWMLETQVTQNMWESVMGNNPSYFMWSRNFPVESVSWNDCQEFITKLNSHLAGTPAAPVGYKFSLPTEAQWEYACRAGTTTPYHFGNTLTQQQANFYDNVHWTKEVGGYPANAWGLRDMHGNVHEWCQDWYDDYPSDAVTDPLGFPTGSEHVLRGGSWRDPAVYCGSADRYSDAPTCRDSHIGCRLSLVRAE